MFVPLSLYIKEDRMEKGHVGAPWQRVDAFAKVTGSALYTADIKLPRMLHAAVLRSGKAHARILKIDTSEAEQMSGVRKIVTGSDPRLLFGTCLVDQPPIAVEKTRHPGEAVAVAIADTPGHATAAIKKINVDYEELPFVLDPRKAAAPDAVQIHEKNGHYKSLEYPIHPVPGTNIFHHYKLRNKNVDAAFSAADVVIEEEFEFPLSSHAAIEPHAAICRFDLEGNIELWASNQAPFVIRDVLSKMFDISTTRIRVHIPYLGGGFGGKSDVSVEPLVAYAASFVPGHPVKLVLSRKEVFTSSLLGRGMSGRMKIGATREGMLAALESEMYFADGAYGDTSWPVDTVAGHNCSGPYHFPAAKVDVYGVYTNSPPVGAYRGYGHPEGEFMVNRMLDILAHRLEIPVTEIMRKNLLKEDKTNLLGQTMYDYHGDLEGCLDSVIRALAEEKDKSEDDTYLYGTGIACLMKSPKMAANASSGCHLSMDGSGNVNISLSGVEMGQGCHTVFLQMAAEALQIPASRIRVAWDIDTQHSPWDWQTVASMQTYRGGKAIIDACQKAIAQLKENAAAVLECDPEEVTYDGHSCFHPRKGDRKLSVASLARGYSYKNGLTVGKVVETVGTFRVPGVVDPDPETGMGNAAGSWTFGCQGARIRIHKESGQIEILHFATALDPGRVINPQTARGQVTGGVVQGLGATLMEKIEFKDDGQIRNINFGPYKMPRLSHMPHKFTVDFLETPNTSGPWGAKPLGEHPIVTVAPAVLNAIRDATGADFFQLPVTSQDIKNALGKE